ncbi:hypothetical protein [Chamaesiphon minutus]|uniref:hypothetical protein n=1 Tax=Chamaesiphon minutus TaxID=1173032 RepID=UPI0002EF24D1|nr:hypothetical protein [Chamaesiphon minutus]
MKQAIFDGVRATELARSRCTGTFQYDRSIAKVVCVWRSRFSPATNIPIEQTRRGR